MYAAGIHDMPMAAYLLDPCAAPSLSSGSAHRLLTRSPRHVWATHPRFGGEGSVGTNASDMGTVAHDLLLGGEGKLCIIEPADFRSKPTKDNPDGSIPVGWTNGAIRAARDEARANGLTPILAAEAGAARAMVKVAREFLAQTELVGVLDDGHEAERTVLWQEGTQWMRARPDSMNRRMRVFLHYKTTQASANPDPFIRGIMSSSGYDVALAFYARGARAVGLHEWLHVILVQEQAAPYACSLVGMSPVMWSIADQKVERAIGIWSECMRTDHWPAYSTQIHYAEPTAWQLAEAEEFA